MKEWFDNKSIAIIGNAKSLFDMNYGNEIDSHDVVIRINRGIEICTRHDGFKTHGNKVDVWCFNLYSSLENFDNNMKKQLPQTYKRIEMFYNPNNKKIDSSLPKEYQLEIANQFKNKKVTTGLRTLHLISKFNTREVNVYGFDWKKTPTFYNNRRDIEDVKDHDYPKEKEYCFNHYFKTGKFTLKV
jgi:hypothetical protein